VLLPFWLPSGTVFSRSPGAKCGAPPARAGPRSVPRRWAGEGQPGNRALSGGARWRPAAEYRLASAGQVKRKRKPPRRKVPRG